MFVIWHEKILICGRARNESVVSRARESHVFFFEISLSLFFFVFGQLNFSLASLKIALLLCRRSEKKLYSCVFLGDFIVVCMFAAFARGSFLTSITRRVSRRRAERSCFWSRRRFSLASRSNSMTTSKDDDDSSRRYGRIGDVVRKRLLDNNTKNTKNNINESIASSNNHRTMVTSSSSSSKTTEPIKKRAAVLVLLFENTREEIHVLLTKRSADMNSHAGQVAFPGGKLDDEDLGDDIECALREAKEEIGLNRNHVKVLTVLPPILSAGLISVRPVVCAVTDVRNFSKMDWLRNQPSEVERTFSVRLDQFLREDERHTFNDHAWKNAPCAIRVHSFRVDEEEMIFVGKEGKESSKESSSSSSNNNNNSEKKKKKTSVCWGLTAAVLIETAKIVYNKEPEFERDCVLEGGASIWDLVANKDGTGVELRPGVSKI